MRLRCDTILHTHRHLVVSLHDHFHGTFIIANTVNIALSLTCAREATVYGLHVRRPGRPPATASRIKNIKRFAGRKDNPRRALRLLLSTKPSCTHPATLLQSTAVLCTYTATCMHDYLRGHLRKGLGSLPLPSSRLLTDYFAQGREGHQLFGLGPRQARLPACLTSA